MFGVATHPLFSIKTSDRDQPYKEIQSIFVRQCQDLYSIPFIRTHMHDLEPLGGTSWYPRILAHVRGVWEKDIAKSQLMEYVVYVEGAANLPLNGEYVWVENRSDDEGEFVKESSITAMNARGAGPMCTIYRTTEQKRRVWYLAVQGANNYRNLYRAADTVDNVLNSPFFPPEHTWTPLDSTAREAVPRITVRPRSTTSPNVMDTSRDEPAYSSDEEDASSMAADGDDELESSNEMWNDPA